MLRNSGVNSIKQMFNNERIRRNIFSGTLMVVVVPGLAAAVGEALSILVNF